MNQPLTPYGSLHYKIFMVYLVIWVEENQFFCNSLKLDTLCMLRADLKLERMENEYIDVLIKR